MGNPHKHADLIKAWADGASIQYRVGGRDWADVSNPGWLETAEYRTKPEPTPAQAAGLKVGDLVLGFVQPLGVTSVLAVLVLHHDDGTPSPKFRALGGSATTYAYLPNLPAEEPAGYYRTFKLDQFQEAIEYARRLS